MFCVICLVYWEHLPRHPAMARSQIAWEVAMAKTRWHNWWSGQCYTTCDVTLCLRMTGKLTVVLKKLLNGVVRVSQRKRAWREETMKQGEIRRMDWEKQEGANEWRHIRWFSFESHCVGFNRYVNSDFKFEICWCTVYVWNVVFGNITTLCQINWLIDWSIDYLI